MRTDPVTDRQLREAAERGALLLDDRRPGWYLHVEPTTLDMLSLDRCVGGQQDGDYGRFINEMGFDYENPFETTDEVWYGFDVSADSLYIRRSGDVLTEAWREEILRRRRQKVTS